MTPTAYERLVDSATSLTDVALIADIEDCDGWALPEILQRNGAALQSARNELRPSSFPVIRPNGSPSPIA